MEMGQVSVLLVFITFCNIHDAYHFSSFKCNYSEKDCSSCLRKNSKPPPAIIVNSLFLISLMTDKKNFTCLSVSLKGANNYH